MVRRGVLIAVVSSLVTLGVGAAVMHGLDEMHEEAVERSYESSLRASLSIDSSSQQSSTSGTSTSSVVAGVLPTQTEVDERLKSDLESYIAAHKNDLVAKGSLEDNRDAFEDQYIDVYVDQIEPGLNDAEEDKLERMVDKALMSLRFEERILAER
jgi:hypothetical protein